MFNYCLLLKRMQLVWCVTGRKQEMVGFAKRKPLPRPGSISTVCDYRYANPLSSAIFRWMPFCVCSCVDWVGFIAYVVSRYSEWLWSDFHAAFHLSCSLSLSSAPLLFFFLCVFCPLFLVWFSLTSFCVGLLISSFGFLLRSIFITYYIFIPEKWFFTLSWS